MSTERTIHVCSDRSSARRAAARLNRVHPLRDTVDYVACPIEVTPTFRPYAVIARTKHRPAA
ncbi:MAG: hypothetical protein AB7L84_10870 [Acidimicrobiia bacterium]